MTDNDLYHADKTRIGKSGLDLIHRSPAHYWAKYLDPNREWEEKSAALAFGSALHVLTFEPEIFANKFVIAPEINKRTKEGKEAWAAFIVEHGRKTIITPEDYERAQKMKEAVYQNRTAAVLLESGVAETRYDWQWDGYDNDGIPITVPCKIKPDWISSTDWIVDLKTTEDASPAGFGKSVWNYRYHVQGAFYTDGYTAYRQGEYPKGFVFIAVEKSPPYAVAVYYLLPEHFNIGRREYEADLIVYQRCLQTNEWPAYGEQAQPVQLPYWASKSR